MKFTNKICSIGKCEDYRQKYLFPSARKFFMEPTDGNVILSVKWN